MQLEDYSAHIIVDGKELAEYDTTEESHTKVTCWIASEEGKSFTVRWNCHKQTRSNAVSGHLTIDGISCGSHFLRPGRLGTQDTVVKSCVTSDTAERDFLFSRVQLSDDDSLLDKEVHKGLGEIRLTLRHGQLIKIPPKARRGIQGLGGDDRIHEKTKKATAHRVGFGPERIERHKPLTNRVVPNNDPRLVLVFKYQPLNVLQANGIAPRPVPTDRGTSVDKVESVAQSKPDLPDVKPHEVDDRIQSLENELKRLRAVQSRNCEDRKPKRVKTEDPEPRRKQPLFTPGEIIDLT